MKTYPKFVMKWVGTTNPQECTTVVSHRILRDGTLHVTFAANAGEDAMEWLVPPHSYQWVNFKRPKQRKSAIAENAP